MAAGRCLENDWFMRLAYMPDGRRRRRDYQPRKMGCCILAIERSPNERGECVLVEMLIISSASRELPEDR